MHSRTVLQDILLSKCMCVLSVAPILKELIPRYLGLFSIGRPTHSAVTINLLCRTDFANLLICEWQNCYLPH